VGVLATEQEPALPKLTTSGV